MGESGQSETEKFQNSEIKQEEDRGGRKTEVQICSVLYIERKVYNKNLFYISVIYGNTPIFIVPGDGSCVKVKCTLVQTLRLCTGRTACRGSRGIAVLYRH